MTGHSNVMSGSTTERRINCPGSMRLEREAGMPDESSWYADEGSMLHAAMEILLLEEPDNEAALEAALEEFIGQDMGYEGHKITEEHVDNKLRLAYEAWQDIDAEYNLVDMFVEERVDLGRMGYPEAYGFCDVFALDEEDRLHIIDWKFGDGFAVDPEENVALGFYAAAVLNTEETEIKEFLEASPHAQDKGRFVFHIVQPRGQDYSVGRSWEVPDGWLDALMATIKRTIDTAHSKNPPLKRGGWCKYCRGRITCPEFTTALTSVEPKLVGGLTKVQLGEYLNKADLLYPWITDLYKYAQQYMDNGGTIPGRKLVYRRSAGRRWIDSESAEKKLLEVSRTKNSFRIRDLYRKVLLTPTQFDKAFPKLYKKHVEPLVETPPPGTVMVPEADKRPAVTGSTELLGNSLNTLKAKQNGKS